MSSNLILPLKSEFFKFCTKIMLLVFDNLFEIKVRVFYIIVSFAFTSVLAYINSDVLIYVWVLPFVEGMNSKKLIFTSLSEAFLACIFVSLKTSLLFSVIFLVYNVFCFLKPGLYENEYYVLRNFVKLSSISFVNSVFVAYSFFVPLVLNFFLKFEHSKLFELTLEAKIFDYLELVFHLTFLLVLILQLPMIGGFLVYVNLLNLTTLVSRRREFVLAFLVIGALVSPPDVNIQLFIGLALLTIFEMFIFGFGIVEEYRSTKPRRVARMVRGGFAKSKPANSRIGSIPILSKFTKRLI